MVLFRLCILCIYTDNIRSYSYKQTFVSCSRPSTTIWWLALTHCGLVQPYAIQKSRSTLVQIMACHLIRAKPLPESRLTYHQLDPFEQWTQWNFYQIWKFLLKKMHMRKPYAELLAIFFWLGFSWRKSKLFIISHYHDVIIGAIASLITSLTIVYSTVYSDADQRKHQSSASLDFVWGIHGGPVNSPHKGPVTRKMFPFDDVIMATPLTHWGLVTHMYWWLTTPKDIP